ncbi:type II toxin-antitoxin system PemK/MazF family toxin [Microbispora hainanensis]
MRLIRGGAVISMPVDTPNPLAGSVLSILLAARELGLSVTETHLVGLLYLTDVAAVEAGRPVVVLSGDAKNQQPDWDLIYVAPLSTATTLKTEYCVKLAQGTANLSSKCWVRTRLCAALSQGRARRLPGAASAAVGGPDRGQPVRLSRHDRLTGERRPRRGEPRPLGTSPGLRSCRCPRWRGRSP